jgi:hypothetical protein
MAQLNELKRMQQLAGLITESQLEETEQINEIFGLGTEKVGKDDTIILHMSKPVSEDNPNNIVTVKLNYAGDGKLVSPKTVYTGPAREVGTDTAPVNAEEVIAVGDRYFASVDPKDWEGEKQEMREKGPKITKIEVIKNGQSQPKSVKKIQFAYPKESIDSVVNEALAKVRKYK